MRAENRNLSFSEKMEVNSMKEIVQVLAKIWGFIILIGALLFMLLNVYVFVVPCFQENVVKWQRKKKTVKS